MSDWRPISTAKLDEDVVLLGWWFFDPDSGMVSWEIDIDIAHDSGPTHWMPLPDDPPMPAELLEQVRVAQSRRAA